MVSTVHTDNDIIYHYSLSTKLSVRFPEKLAVKKYILQHKSKVLKIIMGKHCQTLNIYAKPFITQNLHPCNTL